MKNTVLILILHFSSILVFSQETFEYTIGGENPDFATINEAAEAYQNESHSDFEIFPGDTIFYNIRHGVYNEQVEFTGYLNFDVVVVFQPDSENSEVVIEYENDGANPNFLIGDIHTLIFRDITFKNSSEQESAGILKVSGNGEIYPPDLGIYNCRFESDLENVLLEKPLIARSPNYHGIVVQDCYFEGGDIAIDLFRVSQPFNSWTINIYNNQFDSVYTTALKAEECESLIFKGNTIDWSYTDGVKSMNSSDITLLNNAINARNAFNCIMVEDSAVVKGNEITGFGDGFGVQASASPTGIESFVIIEYNSFIESGDGVKVSSFDEVYISENNFLNLEGEGASGISVDECQNGFVFINANKIIGSSGSNGVEMNVISGLNSPIGGNHRVTNNMISGFNRAILLDTAEDVDLLFNSISSYGNSENALALQNTQDISLMNNAVKHYGTGEMTIGEVIFSDGNLNFESNFNVYDFDPQLTPFSSEHETLENAQLSGIDENSTSAAINYFDDQSDLKTCGQNLYQEGTALLEVSQDIFGFDRSQNQPTVGAQEIFSPDAEPIADFELTINEFTITTENNTVHGGDYFWEFGDGNTSEEFEPIHTYQQMSGFGVTLNVESPCGSDNHTVLITIPGVQEQVNKIDFTIYPNPTSRNIYIQIDRDLGNTLLKVFDLNGKQVIAERMGQNKRLDLQRLEKGTYILLLENEGVAVGSQQFIIH